MILFFIFGIVGGFLLAFLLNILTSEENSYGICCGAMFAASLVAKILFTVLIRSDVGLFPSTAISVAPGFLILLFTIKWGLHIDWKQSFIGAAAGTLYFVACTVGLSLALS